MNDRGDKPGRVADITAKKERERQSDQPGEAKAEQGDQVVMAAKAMAVKEAGATPPNHPLPGDQPTEGFRSVPRPDYPPSGAFDAEGHRPVLERSRKER